jgi:hypothetical protein
MKKLETLSNLLFLKQLKEIISDMNDKSNIKFDVLFKAVEKKFDIAFPSKLIFINPCLIVSKNLAQRMGYGLKNVLSVEDVPNKTDDVPIDMNAEKMSKILCNDTGMILICDDGNFKGSYLSQMPDSSKIMASLFSTPNGTMETIDSTLCGNVPTTSLSKRTGSDFGKMFLKFRMYRCLQDEKGMEPFVWTVASKLSGFMKGSNKTFGGHL